MSVEPCSGSGDRSRSTPPIRAEARTQEDTMRTRGLVLPLVAAAAVCSMQSAAAAGDRVCGRFTAFSPGSSSTVDTRWQCSQGAIDSPPIGLGDDTGWKSQVLLINTTSSFSLCMRHTRSGSGFVDTGWKCSKDSSASEPIPLGDDTGWRNQTLQILNYSPTNVCFKHTRFSSSSGLVDTDWVCSRNGMPSRVVGIGDDTGWRGQT